MKLIVGLGNPGREYAGTRHNVGFEAVEMLAKKFGWSGDFKLNARTQFHGLTMDGTVSVPSGAEKVMLLEPATYMNASGRSVQAAAGFYQLGPKDVLVVVDDVALPCGRMRLRASGSSGGHNGLRDIEQALGTDAYPRLRIGIDPPPPRVPQKDYVLGRFSEPQRKAIDPVIERACRAIEVWIGSGIESAMNQFNAEEQRKDERSKDEE